MNAEDYCNTLKENMLFSSHDKDPNILLKKKERKTISEEAKDKCGRLDVVGFQFNWLFEECTEARSKRTVGHLT